MDEFECSSSSGIFLALFCCGIEKYTERNSEILEVISNEKKIEFSYLLRHWYASMSTANVTFLRFCISSFNVCLFIYSKVYN